ncbi:acyltransferase domain-containing protein [Pseudomonas gingeri]|uniref:Acyltransferase domain-containing protein n=2 Tax=Pseudomonas gingeri TaxID=117681 RepID=A0A7Y7X949_9PSED|nr:acyltransferase domain-containing protein [Pseudomonas gingeri]NWB95603.1 acyltransferase domain-containing protein [Pseudomonas gingeri]
MTTVAAVEFHHDDLVFMFPGQGADPRGGLCALHGASPEIADIIDGVLAQVDAALERNTRQARPIRRGQVRAVLLDEKRTLELPAGLPQMAGYAASAALQRVFLAMGIRPKAIVAQSLGEIAAMVCADVFDIGHGVDAVCALNNAYQEHEGQGAMVLVGASAADTERLLQAVGRPDLVLACVNTARQCVVSGPNPAIEALFEAVMADGEPRLHRLALPYASHHPALAPVAMGFLEELRALPQRPLRVAIHSSVGRRVYTDADDLQQAMADCVVKPADLPHALLSVPLTERTLFVDMGIGDNLARCVGSTLTGGRALAPLMKSPAELAALFAGLVPSGDHDEPASEPPAGALVEHLKTALFGPVPASSRELAASVLAADAFRHRIGEDTLALHRGSYERLRLLLTALPKNLFSDPGLLLALAEWTGVVDVSLCIAFSIQYGLCIGTIREFEQGNPLATEMRLALESGEKVSAYMITEIGGGNSQIATRTEAVFDSVTREFVLHTPDSGALKFTNVGIGDQAKIGVVCARLRVGDKDCGVFPFILDISDHTGPRPGVRMSLPTEIALVPFDYGLAGFDQVRLPFSAWLSDQARIDEHGVFSDPLGDHDKRLVRTLVAPAHVWVMASVALAAVTRASVALALSHSTRRSTMARIAPEASLLRYNTQRRSLFGCLASAYAVTCLVNDSARVWIRQLDERNVSEHADTSFLTWAPWSSANRALALTKALSAWTAEEVSAECRLRCGVAGDLTLNRFLEYQGLGHVFNDAGGNNLLIILDTARGLVASPLSVPVSPARTDDLLDPKVWLYLFQAREQRLVEALREQVEANGALYSDPMDVWNPLLVRARELGEAHGLRVMMEHTARAVEAIEPSSAKTLLGRLSTLFALGRISRHAAWFMSEGLLDDTGYRGLEAHQDQLCSQLAEHTAVLIDAFGYPGSATQAPIADPRMDYASALAAALRWNVGAVG